MTFPAAAARPRARGTLPLAALLALSPAALAGQTPARHAAHAGPPSADVIRRTVDSLAQDFLKADRTPGMTVVVVRGRDTVVARGYGYADLEHQVPAAANTVYRIGSITKQFTSAAVMQLVEEGKVKLDAPISTYLQSLPEAWRPVTVAQLLDHTSGIPSYTSAGPRWMNRMHEPMLPDSIIGIVVRDTMDFAPGARWSYNNTGYLLLGRLIETVSGKPYMTYLNERVIGPVGLPQTTYCSDTELTPHRARGYSKSPTGWKNARYLDLSQPWSAGALCSSALDLAKWNRALAEGKVVSAASYKDMTTARGAATRNAYGFGLSTEKIGDHVMVEHGGGINGFVSANGYFPAETLSVTVLTNVEADVADRLLRQVARAALGVPLEQPPKRVAVPVAQLARYAGTYELTLPNGSKSQLTVTVSGDKLMGQGAGQSSFELIPLGDHVFLAGFDERTRMTFGAEGAKAATVTLAQGSSTIPGKRVGDAR